MDKFEEIQTKNNNKQTAKHKQTQMKNNNNKTNNEESRKMSEYDYVLGRVFLCCFLLVPFNFGCCLDSVTLCYVYALPMCGKFCPCCPIRSFILSIFLLFDPLPIRFHLCILLPLPIVALDCFSALSRLLLSALAQIQANERETEMLALLVGLTLVGLTLACVCALAC